MSFLHHRDDLVCDPQTDTQLIGTMALSPTTGVAEARVEGPPIIPKSLGVGESQIGGVISETHVVGVIPVQLLISEGFASD
jgi:hypothetical protein